MKKLLLLAVPILFLTGRGVEPISGGKTNETSYYIQDSKNFDFYVDKETCVEYIIYHSGYRGGIMSRLNADNTLSLNKTCLKDRGE